MVITWGSILKVTCYKVTKIIIPLLLFGFSCGFWSDVRTGTPTHLLCMYIN